MMVRLGKAALASGRLMTFEPTVMPVPLELGIAFSREWQGGLKREKISQSCEREPERLQVVK